MPLLKDFPPEDKLLPEIMLDEFRASCSRNQAGLLECEEWKLEAAFDSLLAWAEERCQEIADQQESVKGLRAAEDCKYSITLQRKPKTERNEDR